MRLKILRSEPDLPSNMYVSALYDPNREGTRELHVLLVESDPAELKRTGTRLLEEGCVVSTSRIGATLFDAIERLKPDLVLLDPLLPGLDLGILLARCSFGALPPIALHTKVVKWLLREVLNLNDFVGVIHKTGDDQAFQQAFQAIAPKVLARNRVLAPHSSPAVSGTHRVGEAHERPEVTRIGHVG